MPSQSTKVFKVNQFEHQLLEELSNVFLLYVYGASSGMWFCYLSLISDLWPKSSNQRFSLVTALVARGKSCRKESVTSENLHIVSIRRTIFSVFGKSVMEFFPLSLEKFLKVFVYFNFKCVTFYAYELHFKLFAILVS